MLLDRYLFPFFALFVSDQLAQASCRVEPILFDLRWNNIGS